MYLGCVQQADLEELAEMEALQAAANAAALAAAPEEALYEDDRCAPSCRCIRC